MFAYVLLASPNASARQMKNLVPNLIRKSLAYTNIKKEPIARFINSRSQQAVYFVKLFDGPKICDNGRLC